MSADGGIQRLINFWAEFECTSGDRRVHKCDEKAGFPPVKCVRELTSVEVSPVKRYFDSPSPREDGFHLSLTPVPYIGDLKSADIFLLMTNPGVNYHDYGEDAYPQFQEVLKRNRKQEFDGAEPPCFALDPRFWWSGWFSYYEANLRPVVCALAADRDISYLDALDALSRRLAILELVPYYSANADRIKNVLMLPLPSANAAKGAAQELAQKAKDGKATIIVRWKAREWDMAAQKDGKNIISLPHVGLLGTKAVYPIRRRLKVKRGTRLD
jgi:hypothetical protein